MVAIANQILDRGMDDESLPSLFRSYRDQMRQEFKSEWVPTLADGIGDAVRSAWMFDDSTRNAIQGKLLRSHYVPTTRGSYQTPQYVGLKDLLGLTRTMVGDIGGAGGFTIGFDQSDVVIDRARTTQGPWSRCNIWRVPTREYLCPVVNETSQAPGSRWGGFTSVWGRPETVMPPPSDGAVASVRFIQERLLMYSTVSRDLWEDSASIARWLHYCGLAEFRASIEAAMINGVAVADEVPGSCGPRGVLNSPCTVTVSAGSTGAGAISAANIDSCFAAIADGNTEGMCWHAGRDTINAIDQLAVGGQYPEIQYCRCWTPGNPNPWPTLKGKPLFTSPFCQPLGTAGDLIGVDWGDYALTWLRPKPTAGGLEISISAVPDKLHKGFIGIPEGSVEMRVSDQHLFNLDLLAIGWKMRIGGGFFWPGTSTTAAGVTVGPAAVIQTR
jgi:HK97 family phage major capsid protein